MFDWLIVLFAPAVVVPPVDYTGDIAAEVAYVSLEQKDVPRPLVPTKDCKTCNGLGRVRTGDLQGWTKCPDCVGIPGGQR